MKKNLKKSFIYSVAMVMILGFVAGSAYATNGYFSHGYGTKNFGMGGAGVALPQDAMAAATNPAGMVFVGNRYDFGMQLFAPNRDYSITGNGFGLNNEQDSDKSYFVIPSGGINWMLGSNSSLGVTIYGNGGMNTEYPKAAFLLVNGSAPTGVDLSQLFVNLSYAHKIMSNASVGVSAILARQEFKAEGLQDFGAMSSDSTKLTNNGYDHSTGIGFKIGAQMDVPGGVAVGASYQPKIDMKEFGRYAGLFAEQGDFDIPSTYTIGAAWKARPNLTVTLDYQRINYTDVASVSNPFASPGPLGADNGAGFGWTDINVYKLGAQYTAGNWTWRAGWNHGDNPIPSSEVTFNILAPGVVEDHLTFGFTKKMSETSEINFAYMHALSNKVTGAFPGGFGAGTANIEMYQNAVELSLGTKF